jgi:hypothetical protein
MAVHHLTALPLVIGGASAAKSPRRRRRRQGLADALKQAHKAGACVAAATVAPDGTVSLTFGQASQLDDPNPWDEVMKHA